MKIQQRKIASNFQMLACCVLFNFYSCKESKVREMQIDSHILAVGQIDSDTVYNGLIKFYRMPGRQLISEYTYKNGTQEGPAVEYDKQGKVLMEGFFRAGYRNGQFYYYRPDGSEAMRDYFYFGLRTGDIFDNSDSTYRFRSLDGEELAFIQYNRLREIQSITQFPGSLIYTRESMYETKPGISGQDAKREIFLYLPDPPGFNFRYSLVQLDSQKIATNVIRELKSQDEPWIVFACPDNSANLGRIGIRLQLKDIDGRTLNLIKAL